ncbi:glycoside hydrolase family 13 protein [Polaribacter sp. MED152]|uniref:glycoside hydrolase family 13 protein n=1 Tax=Polaribacter sp. MED152 TaxID=313598 RepID=UPI0002C4F26B|nr:glycoside hydrolase family 13 protein [Polaribacter sp. MED152]EAQ41125.2 alpha-amylase [Polaribacter sp. MED152]
MKKIIFFLGLVFMISCNTSEDNIKVTPAEVKNQFLNRVEPTNWWVGMKNTKLQLLVHHPNISEYNAEINYAGVTFKNATKTTKSNNYLFLDLEISETTTAGKFDITFKKENSETLTHTYELKSREKSADSYKGFDSSDAIYLITPDRYTNADESNDRIPNLKDQSLDRTDGYKRHGGDLQGITNGVDYISDLGFTAIWPTPVLTNDMPRGSYHGYAITDYYQVDPRFGNLEDYKNLSKKLREKDMKLIMDQVANHCGLEHWWMKDLPFNDWVNDQAYYEKNKENWTQKIVNRSNHRRTTNQDLYASKADNKGNNEGWFVSGMPDLNQRNPFMANYIIQNSIWWIETLGLGGIRQDTYPYPDKKFMANWAGAIMNEYPNFSIVGEEWSYNPLLVGYWQTGSKNKDGYESNLKSTMDFPMQKAIIDGINEEESWGTGLVKIYEGLANDFHYATPKDIMVFLDNHDEGRMFTALNEDATKAKMALSYMLMMPRIPQIYYGTEILMDDTANHGDHGLIRTDFPGGWKGDTVNAFTGEGLSSDKKEMQSFVKSVLNYRKDSKAIQEGRTLHFAPLNGTYFLFRISNSETVVHIINKNNEPVVIDLKRFKEVGLTNKTLKNIVTGDDFIWQDQLELAQKGSLILTTKN